METIFIEISNLFLIKPFQDIFFSEILLVPTVCPESIVHLHRYTPNIKMDEASWTYFLISKTLKMTRVDKERQRDRETG